MFNIETLMVLIPALPLAAALLVGLTGKWLLREKSHLPVIAALGGSFLLSIALLFAVRELAETKQLDVGKQAAIGFEKIHSLWTWVDVTDAYEPANPKPVDAPA